MIRTTVYRIALLACVVIGVAATAADDPANPGKEIAGQVEQELLHAETYYWFGMAEQGNLAAFDKGLMHLGRASKLLTSIAESDPAAVGYRARIAGLRTDLDEQIDIAHDTLYGLFPMTRFLDRSIFAESTSLGTFELIDDPTVMATTSAARKLSLETIQQWTGRHHLDVVFTSVPHNPQLENEALYLFNTHPKYFVHNGREVVDALDADRLARFQAGVVTPEIKNDLLRAFGVGDVLIVLVREVDVVDDDYFYIVEGKIYRTDQDAATHDFAVMGFSRDRNARFAPIVLINLLLLGVAYAAFWGQSNLRHRATVRTSAGTLALLPLVAFCVGRCTPWVVGPLLSKIAPIPETLAVVSFWIPCLAGAAITVVPMIVFWLISKRLARIWPVLTIDGRAVAVFVAIGAGAAGYLSVPLLLYMREGALVVLAAATVGVVGLGYLLGRTLDGVDRLSMSVAAVPLGLSLLYGAAMFQCLAGWAWGAVALVVVASAVPVLFDVRSRTTDTNPQTAKPAGRSEGAMVPVAGPAANVAMLDKLVASPRYQRPPDYDGYLSIVEPVLEGRTSHLSLFGPTGSGLSATAGAIVDDLTGQLGNRGINAILMCGECSHAVGEPAPYGAFRKALAGHFEIEFLAAPQSKLAEIDAALGEVFQSVLPFAGVLFPPAADSSAYASGGNEIVPSIVWMLRRLAKTKPVLLVIDDVQWIDESSRALLKHLIGEFPPGGPDAIALIVAGHDRATLIDLGFEAGSRAEIELPTSDHQMQILTGGVGLSPSAAQLITERVGASTVAQGGLVFLLQIVANLARAGVFVRTADGMALRDGRWPDDVLVPDELRDVLVEQLDRFPQYRMIIECAACASDAREFSAGVVAEVLARPRLELLADLDRIDRETSLIRDVRQRDDVFAFQSSIMLDAIRDELKISERGPASSDVPQIVREYHGRLGACLEKSLEANSNKLYAVANHYYAAGAALAERGTKYSLEAARASCAVLDFNAAENYLSRADECAVVAGQADLVAAERLEIECRRAHLTGQYQDHVEAANKGAEYLAETPDCSTRLLLAIAQVQYDAAKSGDDGRWLTRALDIGHRVIQRATSSRDEAAGRHFVGISLPIEQRDERQRQLRLALSLAEDNPTEPPDYELLGKVMGSLAETLSRGNAAERAEAKALFQRRLAISDTHQVGDPRGQAMTHGGLGRLAFYYQPKDIAAAAFHFRKDLEISEAIGDQQGQIQMHSLLGACGLEEDDVEKALFHYHRSWEMSRHATNQLFAGAGLLACYGRTMQEEAFDQLTCRLLELARDGVPEMCAEELVAALTSCPVEMLDGAAAELLDLTQSVVSAASDRRSGCT